MTKNEVIILRELKKYKGDSVNILNNPTISRLSNLNYTMKGLLEKKFVATYRKTLEIGLSVGITHEGERAMHLWWLKKYGALIAIIVPILGIILNLLFN